jgi:hypothetical protein
MYIKALFRVELRSQISARDYNVKRNNIWKDLSLMKLLTSGSKIPSFALILFSVCSVALLAACGGTVTVTSSSPFATNAANSQAIVATLKHDPTGTADLSWNSKDHQLTVKIALTGLAPGSSHAAHIHAGNCSVDGAVVYPLNTVVADAKGDAVSVTTINNVANGIPASGWYVNVHNGTGKAALDDRPIACGNIANSVTSKNSEQTVHVTLGGTVAPNESASGQAVITTANGKLTLKITLSGLQPDSVHAAHIHAGSCAAQGAVVVMLNPVVADAHGIGTSITTLKKLPTSSGGLYVNVHTGASMSQLAQPTLFNPIACGNLPA